LKETTWQSARQRYLPPAEFPAQAFRSYQSRVLARSQLVWGEHCTECSFPSCQFTCAFYTPRPDLTCQRFENGIESIDCADAQITRIVFRKWGKLEATGPVGLVSTAANARLGAIDRFVGAGLVAAPLPFEPKQNWIQRWNRWKNRWPSADVLDSPEVKFTIEAWTPSARPFEMTLTFLSGSDQRMFQCAFTVSRQYMRLEIPAREIAGSLDLDQPYLVQIEPVGDAQGREIYLGLADFRTVNVDHQPSLARDKPVGAIKVVVWDLDNTLWDGTLADDGLEGLTLRQDVVETIQELDRRGILNSIASKNDAPLAVDALAMFGIDHLFLHPQIGWEPKSDGIAQIAASLDLGIDSFAFVDDLAFERAQVQVAHPTIAVFPETDTAGLLANPRFDVPVTAESALRREMYQAEGHRARAFNPTKTDYKAFVASCDIRLTIMPVSALTAERAFELSQRTNQLNFRASRYTRAEVARLAEDDSITPLVLSCRDRFGDYGIIGFLALDRSSGTVLDLFMSCRVQRKFVEHALVQYLLGLVGKLGQENLRILYRPSTRNEASARLLKELGFAPSPAPAEGDEITWSLPTTTVLENASLVTVELLPEFDLESH
jgi:FkbH-like protein